MPKKLIYSIYKYSHELLLEELNIDNETFLENSIQYLQQSISNAITDITNRLDYKERTEYTEFEIEEESVKGLYFNSSNPPEWGSFIAEGLRLDGSIDDENIEVKDNTSSSYIIFILYRKSIYMLTGGYGASYIKKYIDGYFGLDVLPGLISQTDSSIKRMEYINFLGNRQSTSFMNSNLTSLADEISMRSLNKNLNIEIPLSKINEALEINVLENENIGKTIRIESKDSLVVNRSISVEELKNVIKNLDEIYETKRDEYVLNYFIPAQKENFKKSTIDDAFAQYLTDNVNNKFTIIGDNYYNYYSGSDQYILTNDKGKEVMTCSGQKITLKNCYDYFTTNEIKLSKTFMKRFLNKWKLSTLDENGEELLYGVPIKQVLQGHFNLVEEVDGDRRTTEVFLMNGEWFVLNKKYLRTLTSRYEDLYDENQEKIKDLSFINLIQNRVLSDEKSKSENNYNKTFNDKLGKNIILSHPQLMHNVEFADLITWDDESIYLICVKDSFDAEGVRDLTNQMYASAQILQTLKSSPNSSKELEIYYNKIANNNYKESQRFKKMIDKEVFIDLFKKEPVYVAGYINNYKKNIRSNYAKLLTIDYKNTFKQEYNFEYLIIGDLIAD